MLPKKNRADKKIIDDIFNAGKTIQAAGLTFKFILNKNSNATRISFIVPKNVAKLANRRNLLRRRGYSALEKYLEKVPPLSGVFVFKKWEDDISTIGHEIKNILNKIY